MQSNWNLFFGHITSLNHKRCFSTNAVTKRTTTISCGRQTTSFESSSMALLHWLLFIETTFRDRFYHGCTPVRHASMFLVTQDKLSRISLSWTSFIWYRNSASNFTSLSFEANHPIQRHEQPDTTISTTTMRGLDLQVLSQFQPTVTHLSPEILDQRRSLCLRCLKHWWSAVITNDSGSQDFVGSKCAERIDQATKRIDLVCLWEI